MFMVKLQGRWSNFILRGHRVEVGHRACVSINDERRTGKKKTTNNATFSTPNKIC
jgi:hypothetical protein